MGALIRDKDWRTTSLGAPEDWPPPLKTMTRLMLTTQHPIYIFWGPELLCFYNDAYARSLGPEKHPASLGAPAQEVWPEIWHIIGPQIEQVMAGKGATWNENHLVPIDRHGRRDEVYWTYSYSPINHPASPTGVGGILVICTETTQQVISEQRQREESKKAQITLRETHHRVKNNLATIMAIVGLEQRKLDNPELKLALGRIRARLDSFAELYEMMLVAGDDNVIEAGTYISRLCHKVRDITTTETTAIDCRVDAISAKLSPDDGIALGAIAVELMTNALTHAFKNIKNGAINVSLSRDEEDFVFIIADNGIGSSDPNGAEAVSSTGIGMELVKHYAASLDGSLETQANEVGTTVKLRFPASRMVTR